MVRCTGCGSAVSPWAARCPTCRADLDDAAWIAGEPEVPASGPTRAPGPSVTAGPDPAASSAIGHPGRPADPPARAARPTRRLLAVVAAVAVVLVGLISIRVSGGGRSRSGRPAAARVAPLRNVRTDTIVVTGPTGVRVEPVGGGAAVTVFRGAAGPPLATTGGVAFVHAGRAYLLGPPWTGPARVLGPAGQLFATIWPGLIGTAVAGPDGRVVGEYVDLEGPRGGALGWTLVPGFAPVGQFTAVGPGGVLRAWEPGPGSIAQIGAEFGRDAAVVAANGSYLAWRATAGCRSSGECPLHFTNVASLTDVLDRVIAPPAGHRGFLPGGALSPDGSWLAGFVAGPAGRAQLVLVDPRTGRALVVPGGTVSLAGGPPAAAWSPDGSDLFFSGRRGKIEVYAPGGAVARLTIDGSGSFAVG